MPKTLREPTDATYDVLPKKNHEKTNPRHESFSFHVHDEFSRKTHYRWEFFMNVYGAIIRLLFAGLFFDRMNIYWKFTVNESGQKVSELNLIEFKVNERKRNEITARNLLSLLSTFFSLRENSAFLQSYFSGSFQNLKNEPLRFRISVIIGHTMLRSNYFRCWYFFLNIHERFMFLCSVRNRGGFFFHYSFHCRCRRLLQCRLFKHRHFLHHCAKMSAIFVSVSYLLLTHKFLFAWIMCFNEIEGYFVTVSQTRYR